MRLCTQHRIAAERNAALGSFATWSASNTSSHQACCCAQDIRAELDWPKRLNMALDAAKGMLYLHSRSPTVLHRDLKSANLLVDKHWRAKVADFNLSRVVKASATTSQVAAANPRCEHARRAVHLHETMRAACRVAHSSHDSLSCAQAAMAQSSGQCCACRALIICLCRQMAAA